MALSVNSKPLHIGALLGSLNGAGAEKTILTLCTEFASLGHSVDLITLTDHADYSLPDNIRQIVLKSQDKKASRPELERITAGNNYDFFVTSKPEFYDYIQARQKICSVHITPTAWITDPKWKFIKRATKVLRLKRRFKNKQLVSLSQGIKDDLVYNLGCRPEDINVIPNPYNIDEIRQLSLADGPLPDGDYIVYVASLNKRKRQHDLLQAFHMLSHTNLKLLLVGKGNYEPELKKLVSRLGMDEKVIFWGWDSNPYRLIKNAKLSLLASEAEGLPRVLVESLIIGTPVVSTNCPSGPSEVLTGPLSQYLVPVGDTTALAHAIDSALEFYPSIDQHFDADKYSSASVARAFLSLASDSRC